MLNDVGYGKENSGLILSLVYNPAGAFLPTSQALLEKEYKKELLKNFGIEFNNLYMITNMPISRFLDYFFPAVIMRSIWKNCLMLLILLRQQM